MSCHDYKAVSGNALHGRQAVLSCRVTDRVWNETTPFPGHLMSGRGLCIHFGLSVCVQLEIARLKWSCFKNFLTDFDAICQEGDMICPLSTARRRRAADGGFNPLWSSTHDGDYALSECFLVYSCFLHLTWPQRTPYPPHSPRLYLLWPAQTFEFHHK